MKEWLYESMIEWKNDWMKEWIMNEKINEWKKKRREDEKMQKGKGADKAWMSFMKTSAHW